MKNYLIVGASGYIGKMLVERLLNENKDVTGIVRNRKKTDENFDIIETDITDITTMKKINNNYNYIIHCAAPTQSAYMISNPVETIDTIVNGTKNILEIAKRCCVESMVFISSMEIYGSLNCSEIRCTENDMGYLDILNERSCYPIGKIMAENLCYSYYKEYGIPVKIARLAQTFGRGVAETDNRVFAQFARAAMNNKDIILHTNGNSMGNYCDIDDAIEAIFTILYKGKSGEAYNVVNEENTMKIKEMAEMVAQKIAAEKINVKFDIFESNKYGYANETGLRLSNKKLRELGWNPKTNLFKMYSNLLNSWMNKNN